MNDKEPTFEEALNEYLNESPSSGSQSRAEESSVLELPTLAKQARLKWGIDAQLDKLEEELIEALHAARVYRNNKNRQNLIELFDELADVSIVKTSIQDVRKDLYKECQDRKLKKLNRYLSE